MQKVMLLSINWKLNSAEHTFFHDPDAFVKATEALDQKMCCSWEPGDLVSLDVTWPNGRVSRLTGKLVVVVGDEAYVDTNHGNVVGPVDSLEKEDPGESGRR